MEKNICEFTPWIEDAFTAALLDAKNGAKSTETKPRKSPKNNDDSSRTRLAQVTKAVKNEAFVFELSDGAVTVTCVLDVHPPQNRGKEEEAKQVQAAYFVASALQKGVLVKLVDWSVVRIVETEDVYDANNHDSWRLGLLVTQQQVKVVGGYGSPVWGTPVPVSHRDEYRKHVQNLSEDRFRKAVERCLPLIRPARRNKMKRPPQATSANARAVRQHDKTPPPEKLLPLNKDELPQPPQAEPENCDGRVVNPSIQPKADNEVVGVPVPRNASRMDANASPSNDNPTGTTHASSPRTWSARFFDRFFPANDDPRASPAAATGGASLLPARSGPMAALVPAPRDDANGDDSPAAANTFDALLSSVPPHPAASGRRDEELNQLQGMLKEKDRVIEKKRKVITTLLGMVRKQRDEIKAQRNMIENQADMIEDMHGVLDDLHETPDRPRLSLGERDMGAHGDEGSAGGEYGARVAGGGSEARGGRQTVKENEQSLAGVSSPPRSSRRKPPTETAPIGDLHHRRKRKASNALSHGDTNPTKSGPDKSPKRVCESMGVGSCGGGNRSQTNSLLRRNRSSNESVPNFDDGYVDNRRGGHYWRFPPKPKPVAPSRTWHSEVSSHKVPVIAAHAYDDGGVSHSASSETGLLDDEDLNLLGDGDEMSNLPVALRRFKPLISKELRCLSERGLEGSRAVVYAVLRIKNMLGRYPDWERRSFYFCECNNCQNYGLPVMTSCVVSTRNGLVPGFATHDDWKKFDQLAKIHLQRHLKRFGTGIPEQLLERGRVLRHGEDTAADDYEEEEEYEEDTDSEPLD